MIRFLLLCGCSLQANAAVQETQLDSLPGTAMTCGWEGRPVRPGKSVSGEAMRIGGRTFERGLGTHAPSAGTLKLDGKAGRFLAEVGVDASQAKGTVRFRVKGNGKTLFESGILKGGDEPVSVDVPLQGVRRLELEVDDGGDGRDFDHANWGNARIVYDGAASVWMNPGESSNDETVYPAASRRTLSKGNTVRYIDPQRGDDRASGLSSGKAWKSMAPANALTLAPGDTLVIAPGTHDYSLIASGCGTEKDNITLRFLPGRHVFAYGNLATDKLHISNTNDRPYQPKSIALRLDGMKNVRLEGKGAEILLEGKSIYMMADGCDGVTLEGLTFDYLHPTVCEFKAESIDGQTMDISIAPDYGYELNDGKLTWKGPGWQFPLGGYMKVFDPEQGVFSGSFSPNGTRIEELSPGRLRVHYLSGSPTLKPGQVVQNRDITRDCVGFLQRNSRNLKWKDCSIHAIHGMGVVSQFCENLSFDHLNVAPRKGSPRTNVTWADILHFSGCKGRIFVRDCLLSAAHDDAINVHGTHLRIVEQPAPNKVVVQFMHPQTFGIDGFHPGDEVEFIRGDSLVSFGSNKVQKVDRLDDRKMALTLQKPAPSGIRPTDALENVTWTPSVHVSGTTVRHIPTRGFLLTTRRPVVVENCRFIRTGMPGILVEDDASGWYESGMVKDMTIRGNTFVECAEPVIHINPHATKSEGPVHSNIRIENNRFELKGGTAVRSHHADKVTVKGNTYIRQGKPSAEKDCVRIDS